MTSRDQPKRYEFPLTYKAFTVTSIFNMVTEIKLDVIYLNKQSPQSWIIWPQTHSYIITTIIFGLQIINLVIFICDCDNAGLNRLSQMFSGAQNIRNPSNKHFSTDVQVVMYVRVVWFDYCFALLDYYVFTRYGMTSAFRGQRKMSHLKQLQK